MVYLEAAKLYPNDAASRHACIVARLVKLTAMVEPYGDNLGHGFRLYEAGTWERAKIFLIIHDTHPAAG
jgi:hypothetical protein